MNYIQEHTDKDYPRNIEAEQVVLGSALLEPNLTMPVIVDKKLLPEHFYERRHQYIFEAMLKLYVDAKPCDIVILANALEDAGTMEMSGGRMYLNQLLDRTTTTASLKHFVDIIRHKNTLRELIHAGERIEELGFDEIHEVNEVFSEANQIISSVSLPQDTPPYERIGGEMSEHLEKLERISADGGGVVGVPSGFSELDKLTSGFRDSDLVIIAARPGVGKSSLATSIVRRAAMAGYKAGFFSLEMSKEQILNRLICAEGKINLQHLRTGRLGMDEWRKLTDVAGRISQANIFVNSSPENSLIDIVVKARMMKEREDIDILFIDYLQLITIPGYSRSRENEVAEISRTLKKLAMELDISVVALSQLNRNTESRSKDKRPTLADLRESGAIEQDADMVIFIYRDDYYSEANEMDEVIVPTELIVAKQRNGPIGRVYVSFHKVFVDFYPNVYLSPADEARFAFKPKMEYNNN